MSRALCWIFGHDPIPKWDGEDPWCGRCERYVDSAECRAGGVWERIREMFACEDGGR